ncbi:hypothetical protein [Winogradskyella sp. HaHa_3_26]|uniref:hypothetical protein n=1 Tax=Winogradskyella sp. HaHa_3_26 TaxID=2749995 RepID=UPI001C4FE864|nr:hypothetical protein [Winogradskyella sp. HaHa_3_26]QXP79193.1 hypothetical protein H0I32_00640 [Winogradskyella sp. HaHa_3_26]
MNIKLIVVVFFLFLTSCNSNKITSIDFHYTKPGISSPSQTFCSSNLFVDLENIRFKKITNKTFLDKFEQRLIKLKESDEFSINSRIFALINYEDGNMDTLCIGEYRGICFNGNILSDNEDFHNLIMDELDFYDKKLYDELHQD